MPTEDDCYNPNDFHEGNYGCTIIAEINGEVLYNFNQETGLLQVSVSPSGLEILLRKVGEIPKDGKDIEIQLPPPYGIDGPARFQRVKRIESMPRIGKERYMLGSNSQ